MAIRGRNLNAVLRQGHVWIPLFNLRELIAADIVVAATGAAQGSGGILAKDTHPLLERVNVGTDPLYRVRWIAGNVDPVGFELPPPPDLMPKADVFIDVWAEMSAAGDVPVLTFDAREGKGDTNFGVASPALSATFRKISTRLKGANIFGELPGAVMITPGAHAAQAIHLYAIRVRYTRKP